VLDDTLLADPRALAALDTGGVLRSAATAGAQVRSAAHAADEAGVGSLGGHRPRALVLVRRPGASPAAAGMLTALLGPGCPVPVVAADDVPAWVGPLDVVWAHTADGDDAELADGVGRAVRRGAEVVLSAPDDGPVAAAGAGRVRLIEPRVPVPPGLDLPRALAVGLVVVSALDLLPTPLDPALDALADQLDAEAERNQPGHEPFMNPAKALALRLDGHTPLLWGADAPATAVAVHGAAALATHAGVVANADDVARAAQATGLRRVLDVAARERDIFHDPFAASYGDGELDAPAALPPRLVLLATGDDDAGQVTLRRTGRGWPAGDVLHPLEEVPRGTRHATLLRAAVLASRLDVAAIYLGLATRTAEPA
jgi:Bacterial phospho-glucose isomerase C-terminal SIS domain